MKVRFIEREWEKPELIISYSPFDSVKKKKQDIADYLMGKYDNGMIVCSTPVNERQLLMSYLPFIRTISFGGGNTVLDKNEIELLFESSSLSRPTPIVLEVSTQLYEFLYKRE